MSVICRAPSSIRRPKTTRRTRTTQTREPDPLIDRDELERWLNQRSKAEVEPNRTSLMCGCHFVGWFKDEPLTDIIAELSRWADDPGYFATLAYPKCCSHWCWDMHEDIGIWRNCRLLAVVTRVPDGIRTRIFE